MPVANMYAARKSPCKVGVPDNTIITIETMMHSTGMFLTPNTSAPQSWVTLDLSDGPIVLEAPPNVLGPVDDSFFRRIADISFVGSDKGKGGKYLLLPPGDTGAVPAEGYFVIQSPTYGLWVPWRNFAVNGDAKPVLESLEKNTRIYPSSQADNPPGIVQNKNGSYLQLNPVPPSTGLFWQYLNDVAQKKTASFAGPEITLQTRAIGIVNGQPSASDDRHTGWPTLPSLATSSCLVYPGQRLVFLT
jgi:hypothetical protein